MHSGHIPGTICVHPDAETALEWGSKTGMFLHEFGHLICEHLGIRQTENNANAVIQEHFGIGIKLLGPAHLQYAPLNNPWYVTDKTGKVTSDIPHFAERTAKEHVRQFREHTGMPDAEYRYSQDIAEHGDVISKTGEITAKKKTFSQQTVRKAAQIILNAYRELGEGLRAYSLADLLLDQMPELKNHQEAIDLLEQIQRERW